MNGLPKSIVICGINWGDEGKGRVVDYLASDADVVCRYQGGSNAGHTVINEWGTFKLHQIPSGIFNAQCMNVLGPGMLINPESLVREITELRARGVPAENFVISDRATIALPIHALQDAWEEERLGDAAFGSTKTGIAPGYADRYLKKSLLIGDLFAIDDMAARVEAFCGYKRLVAKNIYGHSVPEVEADVVMEWLKHWGSQLLPYVADTREVLKQADRAGRKIIFEAQLGALRDVVYGIYPYVSSSCTLADYYPIGSGLLGGSRASVVGVMKAFSTCVGAGPFVTEMEQVHADRLRETSLEFGATTGRPRRIGHFDAVASRYGAELQGASSLVLTKLDSLSGLKVLKICTSYITDRRTSASFPLPGELATAQPSYIELPGWHEDISSCRRFSDLPAAAQVYVKTIESLVGVSIDMISVGPMREAMITVEKNHRDARMAVAH